MSNKALSINLCILIALLVVLGLLNSSDSMDQARAFNLVFCGVLFAAVPLVFGLIGRLKGQSQDDSSGNSDFE